MAPKIGLGGILSLLCVAVSLARAQDEGPTFDWTTITPSDTLQWVGCYTPPYECARLNVPLDYENPAAGTAAIAMTRIPTSVDRDSPEYRGPLLYNPGGPGVSGVEWVMTWGDGLGYIHPTVGTNYDLIGFDPRGMANSTPKVKVFDSQAEVEYFNIGPDTLNMALDPDSVASLPARYAKMQEFGEVAEDNAGDIIGYMTTDNVARDMLTITEAHGFDKVSYWGISYGTVIGSTFASLFPDKVERMLLDGNEDVVDAYYSLDWRLHVVDADKALNWFFDACAASGPSCPFHSPTAAQIKQRFDALLDSLLANPVPFTEGGLLTAAGLRGIATFASYEPVNFWPYFASGLKKLEEEGNPDELYGFAGFNGDGIEQAIVCTDAEPVEDTQAELIEYAEEILSWSEYFSSQVASFRLACSGWKIHPDHFRGPVGGETSFPIMFIGNTADNVTPLAAAKKMAEAFEGSRVLTYDIPGHTTFAYKGSACIRDSVNRYFQQGLLPAVDAVCEPDAEIDYFPAESAEKKKRGVNVGKFVRKF